MSIQTNLLLLSIITKKIYVFLQKNIYLFLQKNICILQKKYMYFCILIFFSLIFFFFCRHIKWQKIKEKILQKWKTQPVNKKWQELHFTLKSAKILPQLISDNRTMVFLGNTQSNFFFPFLIFIINFISSSSLQISNLWKN